MSSDMKALIVVTSHDQLGNTGRKTGFYFDEMAHPYWALVDVGLAVDIASIQGGAAPHDPGSLADDPGKRPPAVTRFLTAPAAMAKIRNTLPIADVDPDRYAVMFLPGGHGTMWDLSLIHI